MGAVHAHRKMAQPRTGRAGEECPHCEGRDGRNRDIEEGSQDEGRNLAELELTAESQHTSALSGRSFFPLLIVNMIFQIRFYVCLHLIAHPSGRTQSFLVVHEFGLI